MRSLCIAVAGAILAVTLISTAPGCDSSGGLEEQPDVKKNPGMGAMPGYNKMQDQLKKDKKIK